jgi:ankyrin repeat protein
VDKIGRTPLLYAARYGSLELCEILIQKGARVDVMDGFNETMLHLATVNEYPHIVKYLLEKPDININAQNT